MSQLTVASLAGDNARPALTPAWAARGVEEIVGLAEALVRNFWRLLAQEGIRVTSYQHVNDLPL